MGLAGALIVLPGDGTALRDSRQTAYDDDGLVVLSEIDPALNAAPATFDMRGFRPKYRLINGKPFPASDPISTDQGHTVLLRYVNVGSEAHTMTTLGADQQQVAQGGHPATYPERLVVETVEPGQTADTLVQMPTGPEAKIALYDAAEHLDNNAPDDRRPAAVRLRRHADLPRHGGARSEHRRRRAGLLAHLGRAEPVRRAQPGHGDRGPQ